jgi:hypothetical protein
MRFLRRITQLPRGILVATLSDMQGRYRGLVVVLVIGLCGIFGTSQGLAWTSPVAISSQGNFSLVGTGMGPGGSAIVGWDLRVSPPVLRARIRRPDGSLSAVKEIAHPSDLNFLLPQMEMNPAGTTAVFLWRQFDGTNYRIQLRTLGTNGVLGPVITATPPNKDVNLPPAFGVDGFGNVVLAWDNSHRVQVRTISAGGTLGPITTVSPGGEFTQDPRIAVDPAGDSVIAWESSSDATIRAIQRQSDGTLGSAQSIGPAGGWYHEVGIDSAGNATIFLPGTEKSFARQLPSTGTLGPSYTVNFGASSQPDMATNGAGDSVFAWASNSSGFRTRSLSAGGVLGPNQLITPSIHAFFPDVALSPTGDSVIGWDQTNGASRSDANVVRRAADGTLGSIHDLGSSIADGPQVATNSNGSAIAAWASGRSTYRVRISVDP